MSRLTSKVRIVAQCFCDMVVSRGVGGFCFQLVIRQAKSFGHIAIVTNRCFQAVLRERLLPLVRRPLA